MRRLRNFTGDDLALAEKQEQDAFSNYLAKKDAYLRIPLPPVRLQVNAAKAAYDTAVAQVKTIQEAIDAANNSAYKLQQEQYVAGSLAADTNGAVQPKDYTNYIYIGIAILAILFFWKKS